MVQVGSGVAVDDSGAVSPPAPALPPRRYRGEMDMTSVDRLSSGHQALSSRCVDTTNGESTLPHDTYANQLRKQARRYQQTRGSSFSHPRPPLPDWKPPPPPVVQELPLPPSTNDTASSSRSLESEPWRPHSKDVPNSSQVTESESSKSSATPASISTNYTTKLESRKPLAPSSVQEFETSDADATFSMSQNETMEARQTMSNISQSSQGSTCDSNSGSDRQVETSSSLTYGHPAVDVVSGYDRYYGVGDHTSSLSRSFSNFIPSDSRAMEVPCIRRLSHPVAQMISQPTRHGSHSNETSPRSAESSTIEHATSSSTLTIDSNNVPTVERKAALISGVVGLSARRTDMEIQTETTPSLDDTETSSKVEEKQSQQEVIEPTLTELKFFRRQKFPAEVDCSRLAELVAGLLRRSDRDEALVNVLVPPAGHHTPTDLMAKVLGMADSDHRVYDDLPETLQLRLSARDARHAAL